MEIRYKDIHEFRKEDLESLFLSVEWSSGHYPDKLVVAMRNFETVLLDKIFTLGKENKHSFLSLTQIFRLGMVTSSLE